MEFPPLQRTQGRGTLRRDSWKKMAGHPPEVVEGQDVINKIPAVPRRRNDRPNKDVVLKKVSVETI